ncbi:MAG: PadR family transcriptional regulator [Planctomycetota bacterium]|nr:MAG: PadR family transcriptional regulator [Planctomycetota bacterium]
MKPISNVEFMLLQILDQEGELSGYEINKLVEFRGFREWADIGMTSIYVSLTKLEKKGFVKAKLDIYKKGKGPIPRKIKLLANGKTALKREVKQAIVSAKSNEARFKLGLAGISILKKNEMVSALQKRKSSLEKKLNFLRHEKYEAQGGSNLPQHVKWLFQHSFHIIETEIEFAKKILGDLE